MSPRRAATPPAVNLLDEAVGRIASSLSEVIPPEAVSHLLRAQRELLLAAAAVLEHNTPRSGGGRRRSAKRPARVSLE